VKTGLPLVRRLERGPVVEVDGEHLIGEVDGHSLPRVFEAEPGRWPQTLNPPGLETRRSTVIGSAPTTGRWTGWAGRHAGW
jgi:hypothetical protein